MSKTIKDMWVSSCGKYTLILGDWNECVSEIDISNADLILTDPPYGIKHKCNYDNRGRSRMAKSKDYPDVFGDNEPYDPRRLLALGLPSIIWGANHFASRLPDSGGWLVWDKLRPDDLDQATCELAWTNCVKGVRRYAHLWNGFMRESERKQNYHPTQKPVALMSWCLQTRWTKGFKLVLDPYAGSGPVGVACAKSGIGYIGIEREESYFNIAKSRIQKELAANLFVGNP
ncbi:MAG: hypothetical protein COA96_16985 [SAR86 cluster bacterium]|uniref:Methyltransferase n=1 Tax=SAR86 cluster bacterium TaxID=2030880 RepID=A0A2A5AG95_9GAMM|nr:MAG: hypothetical protein COA96_16985 [SAR86 cluster bacterium]